MAADDTNTAAHRWLVTGSGGQLGHDVVRALTDTGATVVAMARADLDITDPDAMRRALADTDATIVVNCAAYTAVDAAETDEDTATAINADGAGVVASACKEYGARLLHVSTDYVFGGDADTAYAEDAPTGPRTAYGRSKLAGEQAVLGSGAVAAVVRTAWLYGAHGPNFVKTMARLAAERDTVDVVDDQVGSPTWTDELARAIVALGSLPQPATGIWHCVNEGAATWFELAGAVFEELGLDPRRVRPTTTDAFPRPAPRPANSVLAMSRWYAAGLPPTLHWREALHQARKLEGDALFT